MVGIDQDGVAHRIDALVYVVRKGCPVYAPQTPWWLMPGLMLSGAVASGATSSTLDYLWLSPLPAGLIGLGAGIGVMLGGARVVRRPQETEDRAVSNPRKRPPADPAERAAQAAEECRAATREAHEAMQGMRQAETDLRAALAEAREFVRAHVSETVDAAVRTQLEALAPTVRTAMDSSVDKVTAEFDRLGKEDDGEPSVEELIRDRVTRARSGQWEPGIHRGAVACPYCEKLNDAHGGADEQPSPGDVSVCSSCGAVSMFADGPLGMLLLRRLTEEEQADPAVHEAVAGVMMVRGSRRG